MITLSQKEFLIETISSIFPRAKIFAFGSRIQGGAKRYSDLDIALKDIQPLVLRELSSLEEKFSQSDLPFKVDLIDYQRASKEFQEIIEKESVIWSLD